jgi:hypothetical protein
MNTLRITKISSQVYVLFSIISLGYVSLLSLYNPQATMAMVDTALTNNDAISSIRGIYGGVGIVIIGMLAFLLRTNLNNALLFLVFFWLAYATSRIITLSVDGPLGSFGMQWLFIESSMFFIAFFLWRFLKRLHPHHS